MHPSQFSAMYGNPAAMSLERERLGIPPGHHGLDPNDPMVSRSSSALLVIFNIDRVFYFVFFFSLCLLPLFSPSDLLPPALIHHLAQQQPQEVAGFQLPREFVFNVASVEWSVYTNHTQFEHDQRS